MTYLLTDLNSWPLRDTSEPIFKSTNEAIYFAQLIYRLPKQQEILESYRRLAYRTLRTLRESNDPDYDIMMELAVRAQFIRECLEECQRIREESLNTSGG